MDDLSTTPPEPSTIRTKISTMSFSNSASFASSDPPPSFLQSSERPLDESHVLLSAESIPVPVNSTETTISPPVYSSSNPTLVGEIFNSIITRTGLNSRERQILLADLPLIPIDRQTQLHQILALPIDILKSLA